MGKTLFVVCVSLNCDADNPWTRPVYVGEREDAEAVDAELACWMMRMNVQLSFKIAPDLLAAMESERARADSQDNGWALWSVDVWPVSSGRD